MPLSDFYLRRTDPKFPACRPVWNLKNDPEHQHVQSAGGYESVKKVCRQQMQRGPTGQCDQKGHHSTHQEGNHCGYRINIKKTLCGQMDFEPRGSAGSEFISILLIHDCPSLDDDFADHGVMTKSAVFIADHIKLATLAWCHGDHKIVTGKDLKIDVLGLKGKSMLVIHGRTGYLYALILKKAYKESERLA